MTVVRAADDGDRSAVLALEDEGARWDRSAWEEEFSRPGVRVFVAEEGGVVVGALCWLVVGDEAEILRVVTARGARRGGHGRALVQHVLDQAQELGLRRVHLEVAASNHPARALYAAADFVPVGRRAAYYRAPPDDALVLAREISRRR